MRAPPRPGHGALNRTANHVEAIVSRRQVTASIRHADPAPRLKPKRQPGRRWQIALPSSFVTTPRPASMRCSRQSAPASRPPPGRTTRDVGWPLWLVPAAIPGTRHTKVQALHGPRMVIVSEKDSFCRGVRSLSRTGGSPSRRQAAPGASAVRARRGSASRSSTGTATRARTHEAGSALSHSRTACGSRTPQTCTIAPAPARTAAAADSSSSSATGTSSAATTSPTTAAVDRASRRCPSCSTALRAPNVRFVGRADGGVTRTRNRVAGASRGVCVRAGSAYQRPAAIGLLWRCSVGRALRRRRRRGEACRGRRRAPNPRRPGGRPSSGRHRRA